MNYKRKYVGRNMIDVLDQVKKDLGPDALIFERRSVKQAGFLGSFKPKFIEVVAGVEANALKATTRSVSSHTTPFVRPMMPMSSHITSMQSPMQPMQAQVQISNSELTSDKAATTLVQENATPLTYGKTVKPINSQAAELKDLVKTKESDASKVANQDAKVDEIALEMKELRNLLTKVILNPNQTAEESLKKLTYAEKFNELFQDYDFSSEVMSGFEKYLNTNRVNPEEVQLNHLKSFVESEVVRCVKSEEVNNSKIHVFVGPPGVGKTTTIAKIASNEILMNNRKVGMITVDTYRIGAVEQLKTYAEILNSPIHVVFTVEEMEQAIAQLESEGCDMIIVDSIGRSPRDQRNLEALESLVSSIEGSNVYLVMNMSTKYRELKSIMTRFKLMNYSQLVFTKLDESEKNENILNICYESMYPIAYLCTGQDVPADIEVPTKERVMEFIWGGEVIE